MSTTSAPLTDSRIMLRRNLKHILRNPSTVFNGALMPVVVTSTANVLEVLWLSSGPPRLLTRNVPAAAPGNASSRARS